MDVFDTIEKCVPNSSGAKEQSLLGEKLFFLEFLELILDQFNGEFRSMLFDIGADKVIKITFLLPN